MAPNNILFELSAELLKSVGVPDNVSGFEVLQDVIMLYCTDSRFRGMPLRNTIKAIYGEDGMMDYEHATRLVTNARYAQSIAYDNREAWCTSLKWSSPMPSTQNFCLMLTEVLENEYKKRSATV